MFALILSDGDLDLPQHLLIDGADRRAKLCRRRRGIPVKNTQEILMLKVFVRLQAAAGHEGVGDADGGGVAEGHAYVEIIIAVKERIVNDVEDVPLVAHPVFVGELRGDLFKLCLNAVLAGHIVPALQHIGYGGGVFILVFPQVDAAGALRAAGVGNIENVPDIRFIPGHVNEGYALAAAPHIAPHALIPEVVAGAGGGLRALGVDHKLFAVRIFV